VVEPAFQQLRSDRSFLSALVEVVHCRRPSRSHRFFGRPSRRPTISAFQIAIVPSRCLVYSGKILSVTASISHCRQTPVPSTYWISPSFDRACSTTGVFAGSARRTPKTTATSRRSLRSNTPFFVTTNRRRGGAMTEETGNASEAESQPLARPVSQEADGS
jgi:hypothetical protein